MAESIKKKILIVDDHPIVRDGLGLLISEQEDLEGSSLTLRWWTFSCRGLTGLS